MLLEQLLSFICKPFGRTIMYTVFKISLHSLDSKCPEEKWVTHLGDARYLFIFLT